MRAFDPKPPRRQCCDEILNPSTGEVSSVTIGGSAAGSFCGAIAAGPAAGSATAANATRTVLSLYAAIWLVWPDRSIHAPHPTSSTATSPIDPVLTLIHSGLPKWLPIAPSPLHSIP